MSKNIAQKFAFLFVKKDVDFLYLIAVTVDSRVNNPNQDCPIGRNIHYILDITTGLECNGTGNF